MAYQAVIHGAKGLHHYGAVYTASPNFACGVPPRTHENLERTHGEFEEARRRNSAFWDYYAGVVAEIGRMSEIFTAHDADPRSRKIRASAESVEWRIKKYRNSEVVLMVNASESPADVEIVRANGRLGDTIEPYGVRIYFEGEMNGDFARS
jgi:hypothetical protein